MNTLTYKSESLFQRQKWQIGMFSLEELTLEMTPRVPLGVDLEKRHHEVKKLFLKHCAKMCHDNNCDVDDVLQEVYKGILIRNKGKCPFNPKKSSFSTYVVMVAKCVSINYINKTKKKTERESYGRSDTIECEPYMTGLKSEGGQQQMTDFHEMRRLLKGEALYVFDDLMEGHRVSQISHRRKMDSRRVNKTIKEIKKTLHHFRPQEL